MDQLLFKIEEAAKVLGTSRSTVYRLMTSGQLVSIRVGRSRRVTRQALERFVKAMDDRARQDLAGSELLVSGLRPFGGSGIVV